MEQVSYPDRERPPAARDSARAAVWAWVILVLLVLLVLGVGWGLGHRFSLSAPHVGPELPTLPGKTPEPKNP